MKQTTEDIFLLSNVLEDKKDAKSMQYDILARKVLNKVFCIRYMRWVKVLERG